jgi:tetratricopeptide (TPR) repeat protein
MTQNNLGTAYGCLSEHEDPVGNLRRAIEAYEEALRFRTPDIAPLDYAMIQNNLGTAYGRLSEHEDPVGNLRKAIEAYRGGLALPDSGCSPAELCKDPAQPGDCVSASVRA